MNAPEEMETEDRGWVYGQWTQEKMIYLLIEKIVKEVLIVKWKWVIAHEVLHVAMFLIASLNNKHFI